MEPCLLLEHKGDEPFRAPHIVLIALPQMLLEDMLFHPDTITETEKSTSHDDEETQPVIRQAESQSEQRDENASIGGMPNESVGTRCNHSLLRCNGHAGCEKATKHVDRVET